jgi:hypothetical protein
LERTFGICGPDEPACTAIDLANPAAGRHRPVLTLDSLADWRAGGCLTVTPPYETKITLGDIV